jgi:DnaJ-class molecular chaperone
MAEDYYNILGVSRSASEKEIQKAYRERARKLHPDMNPDDKSAKEKFQKLQTAYDTLNDAEKRKLYDAYGSNYEQMRAAGGGQAWRPGGSAAGFDQAEFSHIFGDAGGAGMGGFADLFEQFTGGGRRARPTAPPRRGGDIQHELQIPFTTAIKGGEAHITVRRPSGKVETIAVKIPAGIENGKKIRLRGQGEPSPNGGAEGDIIVTVRAAAHPFYSRRGNDLIVTLPVSVGEAAMGAKIDLPTPKGQITLTVPPGSSSGKRLRVRGHGVQAAGQSAGDLYAELQIQLPEKIDERAADLLRRFDEQQPLRPREDLQW